jgi:hypothetical protein
MPTIVDPLAPDDDDDEDEGLVTPPPPQPERSRSAAQATAVSVPVAIRMLSSKTLTRLCASKRLTQAPFRTPIPG